jgi:hypothetical protein
MEPDRWRRVEERYHSALAQEPERRRAFLAEVCEGDWDLRRLLDDLLARAARRIG